jgi:hypothetical protein
VNRQLLSHLGTNPPVHTLHFASHITNPNFLLPTPQRTYPNPSTSLIHPMQHTDTNTKSFTNTQTINPKIPEGNVLLLQVTTFFYVYPAFVNYTNYRNFRITYTGSAGCRNQIANAEWGMKQHSTLTKVRNVSERKRSVI